MARTGTVLRAVGWLGAGLCGALVLLTLLIHIDQYLLRRRADRLLADIRSLQLRKSTYADARLVIDRWGDDVRQQGACQSYSCNVEMTIGDVVRRNMRFFVDHQNVLGLYRRLGGRPAWIDASIGVQKGVVWHKSITAYIETNQFSENENHTLIGQAESGSWGTFSPLHPEYRIGSPSACTFCTEISVLFTPYADPSDVSRLMDIDFSCLTRWHACRTEEDILPAVWRQAQRDRLLSNAETLRCKPEAVRALSRLCRRVVVGTVTKVGSSADHGEVKFHFEKELKTGDFRVAPQDYTFVDALPVKQRIGERYVLFFPDISMRSPADECPMVPATGQNMETIAGGIAEDLSDSHDGSFPFPGQDSGMKPPRIPMR